MVKKIKVVKDSDILKAARRSIANGSEKYLCYAIKYAEMGGPYQRHALCDWVSAMLGPRYGSYGCWLQYRHPSAFRRACRAGNNFRDGRLAWLDWMIAECEKAEAS